MMTLTKTKKSDEYTWDRYHSNCYDIGGIVIHPVDHTAVECRRIGIIKPEELNGKIPVPQ